MNTLKVFTSKINLPLISVMTIFAITTKIIFDRVYVTSKNVIDEAFHLPQGLAYCSYNFTTWDPKITTLPGLYLLTSLLYGPFSLCSIYWLRFINVVGAVLNLYLFHSLFAYNDAQMSPWKNVISSLNLSLLPPLYFFAHLYYTDIISLTTLLLLLLYEKRGNHLAASFFGMLSVMMRQTNIIWVLMIFGKYFVKYFFGSVLKKDLNCDLEITKCDLKRIINVSMGQMFEVVNLPINIWLNFTSYLIVLISFVSFVIFNGSIVVGDKDAHTVSIHVPQFMYFALFFVVFSWPYFIARLYNFLKIITEKKLTFVCLTLMFVCIVYLNTLVHPYMLADNRHYTFYVWNYFYGRYRFFRYFIIPVYLFGLYCMSVIIFSKSDISFGLVYIPCTFIVLILQRLIEIRYFLIPYVLLRLNFRNVKFYQLLLEFFYYIIINVATMRLFFNKNIYWADFDEPQKLIW